MLKFPANKKAGGVAVMAAALAMPITAHHEGLRLKAYLDPVGIPTICYGETENVKLGDVKTERECSALFESRLGYFSYRVDGLVAHDLPVETHAALTSFTYNVGVGAFKNSTMRRKLNAGDLLGACNEFPRWVYAGGKKWNGLIKRREQERLLCLEGLGYDTPLSTL